MGVDPSTLRPTKYITLQISVDALKRVHNRNWQNKMINVIKKFRVLTAFLKDLYCKIGARKQVYHQIWFKQEQCCILFAHGLWIGLNLKIKKKKKSAHGSASIVSAVVFANIEIFFCAWCAHADWLLMHTDYRWSICCCDVEYICRISACIQGKDCVRFWDWDLWLILLIEVVENQLSDQVVKD